MRYLLPLIILLSLSLLHPNLAAGQEQASTTTSALFQPQVGLQQPLISSATDGTRLNRSAEASPASPARLGLASAGGWAVGTVGLAGLGYGIDYLRGATREKMYMYEGPILGAMIGAAVGPVVGAHFANNYRGNVTPGLLANGALSGLALLTAIVGPHPAHLQVVGISAAQIGLGAWLEYRTGR